MKVERRKKRDEMEEKRERGGKSNNIARSWPDPLCSGYNSYCTTTDKMD